MRRYYRSLAREVRGLTAGLRALAAERRFERQAATRGDAGPTRVLEEAMQWLCRAQDCSTSADGGVARHYSLLDGWSSSYPETTGYIAQTFLAYHELMPDSDYRERADRMLKWLASIQSADGGFQGGMAATPSAARNKAHLVISVSPYVADPIARPDHRTDIKAAIHKAPPCPPAFDTGLSLQTNC